jgi:soluble lytic murein transglycosylase-like protein
MRRRRERKAERRRRGERPREATVEADVEAPSARERGRRRRLALPLIGAAIAGCLALVVTGAGSSALRPSSSHSKASRNGGAGPSGLVMVPAPSALARREIPWRYLRLYVKAADEYGLQWTMLAAVGQTESHSGQSVLPGVTSGANSAGATGPAQFETATWERFGVNVDGHGADPYDPADAITAMAAYLKASGAPENWAGALWTYNHSTAYVEQVLALSAKLGQAA